jgi:hypothetical protein
MHHYRAIIYIKAGLMKFLSILILLVFSFSLLSCSYFARKKCEEVNWHQYGYDLAMKSKRPASDNYIKKCEEVEALIRHDQLSVGFKEGMAKFCTPDTAYKNGRDGAAFVITICDEPGLAKKLKGAHKKGRNDMCENDGYKFGKAGKIYDNHCSPKLEQNFLKEYAKGRVVYLQEQIISADATVDNLNEEVFELQREQSRVQTDMHMLRPSNKVEITKKYDAERKIFIENRIEVEDTEYKRKMESLKRRYESLTDKISSKRRKGLELRKQSRQHRHEISVLQNKSR